MVLSTLPQAILPFGVNAALILEEQECPQHISLEENIVLSIILVVAYHINKIDNMVLLTILFL